MIFVRLDENISYKIAPAAELLRIPGQPAFESALKLGQRGLADEHWMAIFGRRGKQDDRRIVFTADAFTVQERVTAEVNAVTIFYTPTRFWRPLGRLGQAAYILRWMSRSLDLAKVHAPGAQFQLPRSFNTRLEPRVLPSILERAARASVRGKPHRARRFARTPGGRRHKKPPAT